MLTSVVIVYVQPAIGIVVITHVHIIEMKSNFRTNFSIKIVNRGCTILIIIVWSTCIIKIYNIVSGEVIRIVALTTHVQYNMIIMNILIQYGTSSVAGYRYIVWIFGSRKNSPFAYFCSRINGIFPFRHSVGHVPGVILRIHYICCCTQSNTITITHHHIVDINVIRIHQFKFNIYGRKQGINNRLNSIYVCIPSESRLSTIIVKFDSNLVTINKRVFINMRTGEIIYPTTII